VSVCLDITERKQAEDALHASENLYLTLSQAVPNFIWSCDARGQLDFVNSRWLEYAGMSVEELNAGGLEQVYHPEDFSWVMQQWNQCLQQQEPFEVECRYRRKDGDGTFLGYIGSGMDISDRKRTEQAQQYLVEASRVLSSSLDYQTILASIAHLSVPHLADWCTYGSPD
jgi:PAS domain S-box-containing protein